MKNGMDKQMRRIASAAAALTLLGTAAFAAGPNADQATRMYNRIAGVPPSATVLANMMATDPVSAALMATNDPAFYNDTIRNLAAPWTNRDQSVFVPLNDYTATVVGMVLKDIPFNTLLTADVLFVGDGSSGEPAYSPANNDMYTTLDENNVGRFCDIVRDMSRSVQFIFITHNKSTMELASQLVGVTMNEPGVSRLVAVDVDEAVRMAAM